MRKQLWPCRIKHTPESGAADSRDSESPIGEPVLPYEVAYGPVVFVLLM
jgi:hypothetical protein